ncbi:MAG TPA: peptidoglycan-binding protein [Acidimicrobiales bacterium]|nr:peptidoglycan-binding protein [Acidimicrobiales bacterium]
MTTPRLLAAALAVALLAAACGDDVAADGPTVEEARAQLCDTTQDYVGALDRYGLLFADADLTVGAVRAGGEELTEQRDELDAAAEELRGAIERAAEEGEDVDLAVSDESVDRLEAAESAFTDALGDVDDDSPLAGAAVSVSSAAFQLQVAWQVLLAEAGCLDDLDESLEALREYVAALQTDLTTLGVYDGPVDGIYGPLTVAAVEQVQEDAGLPVTGLIDRATQVALAERLADQASAQVSALQGLLAGLGYWDGPIDGRWSDELGESLARLQGDLGLEPTGAIDTSTLRALQAALAEAAAGDGEEAPTTTTAGQVTTTTAASPPTTAAPPTTVAPPATTTVVDVLVDDGRFGSLLDAATATGLLGLLTGEGPVTVLAPTDEAFAALPADVADALAADAEQLRQVLLGHVVDGGALRVDLLLALGTVPTADGGSVEIVDAGGGPTIGGATVGDVDLLAGNGVVHGLDAVIVPAP